MLANGNEHRQIHPQYQTECPLNESERMAQYALAQDCLNYDWANNARWKAVERPYPAEDVLRLARFDSH